MKSVIDDICHNDTILAYTSEDTRSFGIIGKTQMSANPLRAAVDNSGNLPGETYSYIDKPKKTSKDSGFRNGDSVFVLEIGDEFSETGFGRLKGWLQHHK